MKNQTPVACLAIIPYNQSSISQNINTQLPNPNNTARISSSFRRKICSSLMEELQKHYTTEELLTITFLHIMTMTSVLYLVLGFELLETTSLSNSISPIAMSIFKYSLALFTGFSIASADLYRQLFKAPVRKTTICTMCLILSFVHFLSPAIRNYKRIFFYMIMMGRSYMACIEFLSTKIGRHGWRVKFGLCLFARIIMFPMGARLNVSSNFLIQILIFSNTFWIAATSNLDLLTSSLQCFLDRSVQKLLPLAAARVNSALKKKTWKLVKFAIGLVGTLIFQNIFRLTTFGHVKAFIYLATSWLANLALINGNNDFGILNFVLGNMILGTTVSQYGLEITTWLTYGVCLFLYILGNELKSMQASQNIENLPRPPILFWIFCSCVVFDSLYNLFHQI